VQPLGQLRLPVSVFGQVQQAVRVAGIATAQAGHVERQPVPDGALLHLTLGILGLLQGHPVLARQQFDGRGGGIGRGIRVEFEGPVRHLDLVTMRPAGQRLLETALAEIAPWTYDIGPDLNLHSRCNAPAAGSLP
jgi:hypothetical protein